MLLLPEWLVTMDPAAGTLREGAVLVEGPRIVYCGSREGVPELPPETRVLEFPARIVLPGLVNAHTHLPMTLLRGLADDLPLRTWLEERIVPAEARLMTPEAVGAGARLGIAELLLGGTTCCADGYFHEPVVLAAAAELGLRGVFAQGVLDFPAPGAPDPRTAFAALRDHLRTGAGGLQSPAVFAHSLYTCSPATLRRAKALAREFGRRFFIHVAETAWESDWCREHADGLSPVAALERQDLLDGDTVLVHAVHVSPADADLIAAHGCAVVINTESNLKLASGVAPVKAYLERGVCLALGTDGAASNNDLDLFGEMATTARMQKLALGDPAAVSAEVVLRLATVGGAQALGLAATTGALRAGYEADLIAVRTDVPHACPLYDPVSHLVYAASASDVDLVLVAGQVRVQRGTLVGVPLGELMARVQALTQTCDIRASRAEPKARLGSTRPVGL
jgi:5-methylthioadenosine/S-adenosylhomocysteine deaminase